MEKKDRYIVRKTRNKEEYVVYRRLNLDERDTNDNLKFFSAEPDRETADALCERLNNL